LAVTGAARTNGWVGGLLRKPASFHPPGCAVLCGKQPARPVALVLVSSLALAWAGGLGPAAGYRPAVCSMTRRGT